MSMIDHDDIDRLNAQARARVEDGPRVTRRRDGKVFRIVAQARSIDGPVELASVGLHSIERITVAGRDFARDFIDPRKEHATMSTGIATDNGMTFGTALSLLKRGARVARVGWNGKGMFLVFVPAGAWSIPAQSIIPGAVIPLDAFIGMKTAGDTFVPWPASQTDILANDWTEVE